MARSKKIPGLKLLGGASPSSKPVKKTGDIPDARKGDSHAADPSQQTSGPVLTEPGRRGRNGSRRRRRRKEQATKGLRPKGMVVNPEDKEGDLKTISRAINEEWAVPEKFRDRLVPECEAIFNGTEEGDKVRLLAAKVALQANAQNLSKEELELKKAELEWRKGQQQGPQTAVQVNINFWDELMKGLSDGEQEAGPAQAICLGGVGRSEAEGGGVDRSNSQQ